MTSPSAAPRSIAEYRADYEEGRRLRGVRCACGFTTTTFVLACPRCGGRDLTELDLSGRGRLAAFTVQTVPSDEFLNEAPYAYVVVDLEEGGRVTGWIEGIRDEKELAAGTPVVWVPTYKPGVHFRVATEPRAPAGEPPR